jgi:hypothetical protein
MRMIKYNVKHKYNFTIVPQRTHTKSGWLLPGWQPAFVYKHTVINSDAITMHYMSSHGFLIFIIILYH